MVLFSQITYYICVETFIVMSNWLEKSKRVSLRRNEQLCDQNDELRGPIKNKILRHSFQKFIPSD